MHVTKDELNQACKEINDRIDDVKDNHLDSIFNAITWLTDMVEKKVNRVYWVIGVGLALLAVILAMLQVFGG